MLNSNPVCLPQCPTLLLVLSREPDGREVERGNLLADRSEVGELVGDGVSRFREQTMNSVAEVLEIQRGKLRLISAPVAGPVIVCA